MLQHQLLHAQQMYLEVKRDILSELVSFKTRVNLTSAEQGVNTPKLLIKILLRFTYCRAYRCQTLLQIENS